MAAWAASPQAARALAEACLRPSFKSQLLRSSGGAAGVRHPKSTIHPTAVVDRSAALDVGAEVGPMCVVGPGVVLGSGVKLLSHVVVSGNTVVGDRGVVHPFACVGGDPQDLKYAGEESWLVMGTQCSVREHSTLNRGTAGGGSFTTVGDKCLVMSGAHVGHDCAIGNGVVLSTGASLAGHCVVEEGAVLGGQVGVRQRVSIGAFAMVGGKVRTPPRPPR